MKSEVIIVGAGPVGCSAALLLARQGISCTLIERRLQPTSHPSAHVINARTIEVWEQIAPLLAQEVMQASPPMHETSEVRWCSSLTGEIAGRWSILPSEQELREVLSWSPYRPIHLGQHLLEPMLWRWVEQNPLIDFRRGETAKEVSQSAHGVTLRTEGQMGRPPSDTHAQYLLCCDGANSRLREQIGITMSGPIFAHVASVYFHADLSRVKQDTTPLLAWIYNPKFCGVLINHMRGDFILMAPYFPPAQTASDVGTKHWQELIPHALGSSDIPFQIKSCGTWVMTGQVASAYRTGRVFLVGDTAHRFPPTGGYGLNTGVQEAHNLAWKLAAVIQGRAAAKVLDTYETERRPIAEYNCQQSINNHFRMDQVTAPMHISAERIRHLTRAVSRAPFTWLPRRLQKGMIGGIVRMGMLPTSILQRHNARAQRVRQQMAKAIPMQAEHFGAQGVELGFAYTQGMVIPDGSPKPITGDGRRAYRPTTWPGARLPHLDVCSGDTTVPLHQLLHLQHFSVLVGPAAKLDWQAALQQIQTPKGLDLALVIVDDLPNGADAAQAWRDRFEVGDVGMVLVRPDGHVAWRTSEGPLSAVAQLSSTLQTLWTGSTAS